MSMTESLKTACSLREAISQADGIAMFAGAHDVVSALLAERAGYDGVWASSLAIATACGHLDDDRYTMSDVLSTTVAMTRVVKIPVIADVGAGWSADGDVGTIVTAFEAARAAGLCVEETAYPRRNSLYDEQRRLTPMDEFATRISRAVSARLTTEFLILARVEALIAGLGCDETLRRAAAYEAAGADAIVVHSTSLTHDEVEIVARRWTGNVPLALIPTKYPRLPISAFRRIPQAGMLIYANHSLRASMKAMELVLQQIQTDGHAGNVEQWITPVNEVLDLQSRFSGVER